jgi:hypothetical protein
MSAADRYPAVPDTVGTEPPPSMVAEHRFAKPPMRITLSADEQMRVAAVDAASRYLAGEATRTFNSEGRIVPLAEEIYQFIKDGEA